MDSRYLEAAERKQTMCPSWAVVVGYTGVAVAVSMSSWGAAWGTWKSGVSLLHTGIQHPNSVMKNIIPVVMSGVIGIYGLIVAVILSESILQPQEGTRKNVYSIHMAFAHLCSGLCVGISGLAAGGCIGIVGDYGVRAVGYRASQITLFPTSNEKEGYSTIAGNDEAGGDDVSGSEDQNKLFVGMLIMLIFSEALALYGLIVGLIVSSAHSSHCGTV